MGLLEATTQMEENSLKQWQAGATFGRCLWDKECFKNLRIQAETFTLHRVRTVNRENVWGHCEFRLQDLQRNTYNDEKQATPTYQQLTAAEDCTSKPLRLVLI